MTDTQDILFNVTGQSLYLDCPEGRPSSVTSVAVYEAINGDDSTAESATTGSAAVETNPNTTLSAAAGADQVNPQTITVASATGITRGRTYRIENAQGEYEEVNVAEISSTTVKSRTPLHNTYAQTTGLFYSTRISIGIDSTWVADKTNISGTNDPNARYRVRWEYVVGGVTYVRASYFDLVRYTSAYSVTGLDVDGMFPGFLESLPLDDREDSGARVIKSAWREVKLDLHGHAKADQAMRNQEVLDALIAYKANVIATRSQSTAGGMYSAERFQIAANEYMKRFNQLVIEPKVPFADDDSGAARDAKRTQLWDR